MAAKPNEDGLLPSTEVQPLAQDEKHVVTDVSSNQSDDTEAFRDFATRWKTAALVLGVMLSWGSSFSENTLGPLKSTFKEHLGIDNAQYGAISAATSLVNSVLPIIGGYGLDYYGVESGSLICSVVIFLGAVISASGSNENSFALVVAGRVIMGFGSTIIEMVTSKILAHWFQHRGLGFAYGLDISIGKLIVLAAKASAVPMRDANSFWGWAMWIPAIVCFVNLIQNILYVWWVRTLPGWTRMPTGQQVSKQLREQHEMGAESNTVNTTTSTRRRMSALPDWRSLTRVPRMFWLVALTQILQAGTVGGFNGLSADIISETRGSTAELAGYTSAVQQVIPVIGAPLIGTFFDFVGYRMMFVSLTSALWILVYCLIGYSKTNALGSMVISSVASTMNALPFLASIPLMVPSQCELGLVLGIWKSLNNSGSVIVDMIAGALQDLTPGQTYERVIAFFIAVKGLEFCLGLFYGILDRKYLVGILTMSEKRRLDAERQGRLGDPVGRKPSKLATTTGLGLVTTMIIIAWVLFIKYSI